MAGESGGVALTEFNDFMNATPSAMFSSADRVLQEAVKRTNVLSRMLSSNASVTRQGGADIRDIIDLRGKRTFGFKKPGFKQNVENVQTTDSYGVPWRFGYDFASWTAQEELLQQAGRMRRAERLSVYKNLKTIKEDQVAGSMFDGMEDAIFALPVHSEHEDKNGEAPYPLVAFINEEPNGLFPGWTTKAGLNPAEFVRPDGTSRWDCRRATYDAVDPDDSDGDGDGLLDMLEDMLLQTKMVKPPRVGQNFEATNTSSKVWLTQTEGVKLMQKLMRESGDRTFRTDASVGMPTFGGIDMLDPEALNEAEIYADGAGGRTDYANASSAGPRFMLSDFEYIKTFIHNERYFQKKHVVEPSDMPDSYLQWHATWYNLFPRSLQRQGIVYPAA